MKGKMLQAQLVDTGEEELSPPSLQGETRQHLRAKMQPSIKATSKSLAAVLPQDRSNTDQLTRNWGTDCCCRS